MIDRQRVHLHCVLRKEKPMDKVSRKLWYIRVYYACAYLQALIREGNTEDLPAPRNYCMLLRMYLWGFLSSIVVLFLTTIGLGVCLLGLVAVFGFLVGTYAAVFDWKTERGNLGRFIWAVLIIGVAISFVKAWYETRPKKRAASPSVSFSLPPRPARPPGPSFGQVVGQWVRDFEDRTCTGIELVD